MNNQLSLRISRNELSYHQKSFYEQCKLTGRECYVQIPITRDLPEVTTTDYYTYDDYHKYKYYILLDSDPPRKILELFGFSKESNDAKPLIAHCPYYREKTEDELLDESLIPDTSLIHDPIDPPDEFDVDYEDYTFALGTVTSIDNQSDGYPRSDMARFVLSEGCKILIKMHYDDNKDFYNYQSYTVEKIVNVEDDSYVLANLVPERTSSTGVVEDKNKGNSGSRFLLQNDD